MRVITPPTAEPVTLEDAKLHLRVDHADEDTLISACIAAGREQAEAFTRRFIMPQTVELSLPAFPERISLPLPFKSVVSVKHIDGDGVEQTLADVQAVNLGHDAYILPAYGSSWPATRNVPEAVKVRVIVGYDEVPASIRAAILLLVGEMYANREESGPSNIGQLPLTAERLLSFFRDYRGSL